MATTRSVVWAIAFAAPAVRSMPPMLAPEGALPRTIAIASSAFTLSSSTVQNNSAYYGGGILYAEPSRLGPQV